MEDKTAGEEAPIHIPHHISLQKIAVFLILALVLTAGIAFAVKNLINKEVSPSEIISGSKIPTLAPNTNVTTEPTVPIPINTANWKTYEDVLLGFSVKLPIDLDVLKKNDKEVEFATVPPMTKAALTITSQLTNFSSIDTCSEKAVTAPCIVSDLWDKKLKGINDKKLAGVNAKEFFVWREVGREEKVVQTIEKPQIELRFWYNDPGFSNNFYDQILSTFKFTTNGENCIAEGGKGNYTNGPRCCQSLVAADCSPSSDPPCAAMESTCFKCIKCGDGKCGNGETKCNCPSDCN